MIYSKQQTILKIDCPLIFWAKCIEFVKKIVKKEIMES